MNLDLIDDVKKIDIDNEYASIPDLPKQCRHAWDDASKVEIPESYKQVDNLVMCGMGGSGLGARVIESVFKEALKIPLIRVNDYDLPQFVNEQSLVICSSYSGSTEETLENVRQANERGAKWLVISSGGELIDQAKAAGVPFYQINPTYNTSGQPRMAIGYSIVGLLVLLAKIGLVKFDESDLQEIITEMESVIGLNKIEVGTSNNPAKILAHELLNKAVVLVSSEHLVGANHVFNNQINENAKTFSVDVAIPELNHHLMEGLKHPPANKDFLHVIFVSSDLYSAKIIKRFNVTKDVVSQCDLVYSHFSLIAKSKLAQAFELIQFGAFINFYLAMLYGQNPTPIPWVDYFKKQLVAKPQ